MMSVVLESKGLFSLICVWLSAFLDYNIVYTRKDIETTFVHQHMNRLKHMVQKTQWNIIDL